MGGDQRISRPLSIDGEGCLPLLYESKIHVPIKLREHSIITSRLGGGGVYPIFVMQRDAKRGGMGGTFQST